MIKYATGWCSFLSLTLLLYPRATVALPGDDAPIRISDIKPGIQGDHLAISATIENLFNSRIVGTIQSGLPSIVEIEVTMTDPRGKVKFRKLISQTVAYNIWEERYTIRSQDSTVVRTDFDDVKKLASRLEKVPLVDIASLNATVRHSIQLRAQVIPISARQGEKMLDWLQEPDQTEEDIASDDRSSGFRINLSKLVSFFVGNRKRRHNSSEWFSSATFTIADLRRSPD